MRSLISLPPEIAADALQIGVSLLGIAGYVPLSLVQLSHVPSYFINGIDTTQRSLYKLEDASRLITRSASPSAQISFDQLISTLTEVPRAGLGLLNAARQLETGRVLLSTLPLIAPANLRM